MSETRGRRKVEFIESYWTGGQCGSDYVWNDNHGELIRCKDCKHGCDWDDGRWKCIKNGGMHAPYWFCADGVKK